MVVCHCKAVNDSTIRAAVAAEHITLEAVAAYCGAGSRCGSCRDTVAEVIDRALIGEAARQPGPSVGAGLR